MILEEIGRVTYIGIQFLGYVFQSVPIVLLVYAPFTEEQIRWKKKRFLGILIGLLILYCALAAVYLGMLYEPGFTREDFLEQDMLTIANSIFNLMGLLLTLIYVFSIRKGIRGRLFAYLITLQYALTVYTVSENVARFSDLEYPWIGPYGIEAVIVYGLCTIIVVPLLCFGLKRCARGYIGNQNKKNIRMISICSFVVLLSFLIIAVAQSNLYRIDLSFEIEHYISIWWVCTLIIALIVYLVYFFMLYEEEKKEKMMVQMAAFEIQYQSMAEKIREEKRMHHDMRHHFRMLTTLTEESRYEEAKEYLRKYLKEWEELTSEMISRNPMINGVLGYYLSQAKAAGIHIETKIDVKESYPFDMMDLTVLFGNAMENAIEACKKSGLEKNFIRISMCQRKMVLLIQIENSCEDISLFKGRDNLPKSSKKGRGMGYGLGSMKNIVEKYRGEMDFWKQGNIFTMQIMMNIPNGESE